MKILWITNTIFPAPRKVLGFASPVTGGWMYGLASRVAASPDINLAVASAYPETQTKVIDIENIRYYFLPSKSTIAYQKALEPLWHTICDEFKPDIVHIHGTEFTHGLACIRSCPGWRYIVSIQGLVSIYANYYFAGISTKDILRHITLRDLIRRDTLFQSRRQFEKRGEFEKEYLQIVRNVIGRTSWDYAHVKSFNPDTNYYFSNKSLRDSFYSAGKWNIENKINHTIFLSQAYYPIKGAHQVLKAAARLKKEFPDIQIRIAGTIIIKNATFHEKLRLSGYGNYLLNLIKESDLRYNIEYLGSLNETQMINEYRKAHVFICPSSIENSPNSVGEAQLIGTPSIASYVGGIPDMIVHGQTGLLYRFEEVEMLTEYIHKIFTDERLAKSLSIAGIESASKRHDRKVNLDQLIKIYKNVIGTEP